MKNFKKVIAGALALLMLALSVNVSFAAESYTDKENVVVAKVNAAGIMTGTDKGFEPSKTLTRAEAAAIMVRMKGISEDTVKQNAGATLFTDVAASHWAAGYVNVASNYGIIKGVGANKFAPEKEVSVAEFYTMAVRALNAGQLVDSEGTWPTNYVNFAIENKLAEDVAQIYTAAATRMTAATIVANTLEANMWAKSAVKSNGEITWGETSNNILYSTLNIVEIPNVEITGIKVKDLKATFEADAKVVVEKTEYDWTTAGSKDVAERANIATAKAGVKYTVWYDKSEKEVVGFFIPDETTSLTFDEIKSFATSGEIKLKVDGEEEKYKGDSAKLYINGDTTGKDTVDLTTYKLPLSGVAYYGNGTDGATDKLVRIYAESQNLWGVVKEATDKKIKFEDASKVSGTNGLTTITIDLDKNSSYNYAVTKNGKEISITDIEDGDVVFGYYRNGDQKDFVLEVYEDSIEGKVTAVSGNKVTIDGKKYDVIANTAVVKAGDEGTFYLAKNGKIIMFNAEKKSSDVAMISAMKLVTSEIAGASDKLMIKYTTMDGSTSDWTEVSNDWNDYEGVDETAKKASVTALYNPLITTGTPDVPTYTKIGTLVAYTIKGGKVVIKENKLDSGAICEDTLFFGITKFKDAKNDYVLADSKNWYLTSGVKVFEKESNNKTTYKQEVTLKEVNEEDLDDIDLSAAASFIADLDFTQRTAGVLVLEKTNIISEKKWAVVLDIATYDDGDNDTKEDKQVTVLYAGETEETVYIAEAANLKYTNASDASVAIVPGQLVELSVDGDVIKRVTDGELVKGTKAVAVSAAVDKYIVKEYDNDTYTLGSYTAATKTAGANGSEDKDNRYVISDEVVVVKKDNTEYKVASFGDIKYLYVDGIDKTTATGTTDADKEEDAKRINDNNLNGANSLVSFVEYEDEDGNKEVVAIVFNK